MKRNRFSEEQIIAILKEHEADLRDWLARSMADYLPQDVRAKPLVSRSGGFLVHRSRKWQG